MKLEKKNTTDGVVIRSRSYFKTLYSENNAVDKNSVETLIGENHVNCLKMRRSYKKEILSIQS